MQKKLIALAIAGLASAPVFAQSNVTIYGIVDAGVGIGSAGSNDFRGVVGGVLSGNRIGFRGTEDLGNGLKAVFTLEQGFNIDNGTEATNGLAFSRQAFVGLQSSFGTVALGRQYAPGYFAGYDAAMSSIVSPQSSLSNGAGLTITPNTAARWDNSISYTGTFGGVTARAIYAARANENDTQGFDGRFNSANKDDTWGASVEYANGPLKAGVFYHYLNQASTATSENKDQQEWYVGGQYDFGVVTLAGSWQNGREVGAADETLRLWNLGAIVPVTAAGKVHFSYGRLKNKDAEDADAKTWMLGYTHALSKRTTAYATYSRSSNDDNVQFNATAIGVVAPRADDNNGTGLGEDSKLFTVGVRHAF